MRFVSAQFSAYLSDELWRTNAAHANAMAEALAARLKGIGGFSVLRPVDANMIFFSAPAEALRRLQSEFSFYLIDPERPEARLVTSFDTTEEDLRSFVLAAEQAIA